MGIYFDFLRLCTVGESKAVSSWTSFVSGQLYLCSERRGSKIRKNTLIFSYLIISLAIESNISSLNSKKVGVKLKLTFNYH